MKKVSSWKKKITVCFGGVMIAVFGGDSVDECDRLMEEWLERQDFEEQDFCPVSGRLSFWIDDLTRQGA